MHWETIASRDMLLSLIGLMLQLFVALVAYLATHWLIKICAHRCSIEALHPFCKMLVSLFPAAVASSLAHSFALAFEGSEYGTWMPYGSVILWASLIYLTGAKTLQLVVPHERAKGYELTIWLPLIVLLTAMYFVGTLPEVGSFISKPLLSIGGQRVSLLSVLFAIIIIFVSYCLGGAISARAHQISLIRYGLDEHTAHIIMQVTKFGMLALGAFVAIDVLGINLSSLKFFAGAFGLGLGFGMQQIANNLISGVLLLAERSIRVGDVVSVAGQVGRVERMMARAVVIRTQDHRQVIIPNMQLLTMPVVRWSKDNPSCIQLSISTAHTEDLDSLQALLQSAAGSHPMVLSEPSPRVRLTKLSGETLSFEVLVWVNAIGEEMAQIESELYRRLYEALKGAGIVIK
ncbi:MAG: mechanosensitive ion channel [Armatimonadota bacterium]|nr:mechanosensitive ion channel [Armatimonadota bacterium]MCX7776842.1 mechanosensitive ion channel [Armatimonadota bacterium]MDW8024472.1 mechanosensitive ion channel [Armatimonadota bacterium]